MKYIKAFFRRFFSLAHCTIIKIFHWNSFNYGIEQMISNESHFSFSGKGIISIGKCIGMRRNCELSVSESGRLTIGDNCFFNIGCVIACHNEVTIGDNTRFGPNVLVFDHDYDFKNIDPSQRNKHLTEPIFIGNNVWIGGGCIILRGANIGDNCVIGAGCIVKGKIEAGVILTQVRTDLKREIEYS